MNKVSNKTNLLAYLALGAVCIIWGTTYLALRVGVTQFPPFLFSGIRFLIAGPILLVIVFIFGKVSFPTRKIILQQAVSGLLLCAFGVGIVGWSEMYVSSGLAAIICSVMPIWVILINLAFTSDDQPAFPVVLGLLIGLAGIIIIFGEHLSDFSEPSYLVGISMTFAGNICWAFGTVWVKKKTVSKCPEEYINRSLFTQSRISGSSTRLPNKAVCSTVKYLFSLIAVATIATTSEP